MTMPIAERRQIENEMIFRNANEKVGDDLEKLDHELMKDDFPDLMITEDIVLDFLCECSDEDCDMRISMKLSIYQKIHKNRKAFIIKPEHQVNGIEELIRTEDDYCVVEKNKTTPEPDTGLNCTQISNT